jgi:hypothetical protein
MSDQRSAVRITDFSAPAFAPDVVSLRDQLASLADRRRIESSELMATAIRRAGLDDFGDNGFLPALEQLCHSFREDAGLSAVGSVAMHTLLVRLLRNRLLLQHELKANPDISAVAIDRPIFIVGPPRTGSTHLHNIMSTDARLRTLPYWEAIEPVLAVDERGLDVDPRLQRAEQNLDLLHRSAPYFVRMHEMGATEVAEDLHLLEPSFMTSSFETLAPMPSYRDWLTSVDRSGSYIYMRTLMQAMQWLRGGERWLSKSALNHEGLVPLAAAFPDATFVMTHRDPVAIVASLVTMYAYLGRVNLATVDPVAFGSYWSRRVEDFLRGAVTDRDALPPERTIDVHFRDFMRDNMKPVRAIYASAELDLSRPVEEEMATHIATHGRARHGAVIYDLADFGLRADELSERYAFYYERFGIEPEARDS